MLAHPLLGPFEYICPSAWTLKPGDVVAVPLGRQMVPGVVWDQERWQITPVAPERLKPVADKLAMPPLSLALRRLIDWVANYYLCPAGAVLKMALPQIKAAPATTRRRKEPEALPPPNPDHRPFLLQSEQQQAATALIEAINTRTFRPILLDGVTGSGKTEVYFEAIAEVVRHGGQALILLPEIAMTRQWFARFTARFGVAPVEWHSDLTPRQRQHNMAAIQSGGAQVVVGARSALFLPYARLGLIIVDEEHEASFKQEDGVPYQARDVAVVRAKFEQIAVVLASATPSLESYENARNGRYAVLHLPARYGGAQLPQLQMIDLRSDPPARGRWLAQPLLGDIQATVARGEQALLFLNRRGYAPLTLCRLCGERVACPQCSAWLVQHRNVPRLQCHHCGFATPVPQRCSKCNGEGAMVACGPGVERIAEEIAELIPQARTLLLTSDTMSSPAKASEAIAAIETGAVDIIIGTQLATKGHHFPNLTCVGIVDADLGLGGADVRAAERTFQQITQAAGRAGRSDKPGRVWLQSYQPEHPVMQALAAGDRDAFYAAESAARARYHAPPFGLYVAVIVSGAEREAVEAFARRLGQAAPAKLAVLGPAPAPMALLRGQHRLRLLVRAAKNWDVQRTIGDWLSSASIPRSIRVRVDVDPYHFL